MSQTHLLFDQPVITRFDELIKNPFKNISLLDFPTPCVYKPNLFEIIITYPNWIFTQARLDEQVLFFGFTSIFIILFLSFMYPERPTLHITCTIDEAFAYIEQNYLAGSPEYLDAMCGVMNQEARNQKINN